MEDEVLEKIEDSICDILSEYEVCKGSNCGNCIYSTSKMILERNKKYK